MLMFSMPLYEVKYAEADMWQEISELKLLDELFKACKKVTPAINEMILGKEVETPNGFYRLKVKGGEHGGETVPLSGA
jgi:hypothetical protein